MHGVALFLEVTNSELVGEGKQVEYAVTYVIILAMVHQVCPVAFDLKRFQNVYKFYSAQFTCSLAVTAQKTISVKPCGVNMRMQMPPMT